MLCKHDFPFPLFKIIVLEFRQKTFILKVCFSCMLKKYSISVLQDMYLAKRCYDLAAETSPDAKIPVALALIKLSLYFTFKYFKEVSLKLRLL